MKPPKASEILINLLTDRPDLASLDLGTAIKLGIEALNRLEANRKNLVKKDYTPLPREY